MPSFEENHPPIDMTRITMIVVTHTSSHHILHNPYSSRLVSILFVSHLSPLSNGSWRDGQSTFGVVLVLCQWQTLLFFFNS